MTEKELKPLYKIWEEICDEKKIIHYKLSEKDKLQIYYRICDAMSQNEKYIDINNIENPFDVKKWLENEHHIGCVVEKKQVINGPNIKYSDTHYCHVYW